MEGDGGRGSFLKVVFTLGKGLFHVLAIDLDRRFEFSLVSLIQGLHTALRSAVCKWIGIATVVVFGIAKGDRYWRTISGHILSKI